MFEKSRIKRILARFPKAEGKERAQLMERLLPFKAMPVHMIAEELRYNRMLYADAAELFRKLFRKEYIETFIEGLGDTKENVRELFKDTIETQGRTAALPALVNHLSDDDHMIRKMAGDIIAELADASIAPKVIPLLSHDSKDIKKTAMDVLSSLRYERAAQAILPLLEEEDSWLKRKAVEALCKLRDKTVLAKLWDVILRERDPASMKHVIEAVGEIGGPEDARGMLRLVRDQDMVVRQKATEAVIKIGDSSIVKDVIELLQDSDVNVRRSAVDILNGLKDVNTASALVKALKDGDWWVRESATEALSELGGGKISKMVMGLLHDDDEYVRRAAVEFFCRVRDDKAFDELMVLIDDKDWWVREKAVTALGLIGDERAIPAICKLVGDNEVKWAIPKALSKIGGPEVIDPLRRLLSDSHRQIRMEALKTLGEIDDERSLPIIKDMALDDDTQMQALALDILKEKTGRIWLVEDVAAERGEAPRETEKPVMTMESGARPGDIFTEAILVIDLCNSTDLASAYGDHFAFQIMNELNEIITPIARAEGACFSKGTGDGFMITFESVENAVNVAARAIRAVGERNETVEKKRRIDIRCAVNMGETRVDANGDRVGVSVNMVFRVEGVTRNQLVPAPDGVGPEKMLEKNRVLLTEAAYKEIGANPEYSARLLGFFELKGITGLHRLYQLSLS